MKTQLTTLGATAILGLGMTFQASAAAPLFTIDPSNLAGLPIAPYTANQISVQSSTLVEFDYNNLTAAGGGYIKFTGMAAPGGANLSAGVTRLDVDYQVWIEYTYELATDGGTFAQFDSGYTVTALDYTFYGVPGSAATFTQATAAGTAATVTPTNAGLVQTLGTGSLTPVPGLQNVLQGNAGAGASFNAASTFNITSPEGTSFFTAPDPFYDLSFAGINNDAGGFSTTGPQFAAIQAAGTLTFINGTTEIPEPATLALMGLGLLGLGAASTRRRKLALQA